MEAKELRINNWVHYKGEWCYREIWNKEFQWEDRDWYAVGECTMDLNDVYPIPLTEEWLEKFGFNSKYKSVHMLWNLGNFYINQKSDEDDYGNSIPQEQIFYYDYTFEIKYVHQLQNLYYALTGEEL
jgi:hypothetical protein